MDKWVLAGHWSSYSSWRWWATLSTAFSPVESTHCFKCFSLVTHALLMARRYIVWLW